MASLHVIGLLSVYFIALYAILAGGNTCPEQECLNGGTCLNDSMKCKCAGCFIGAYCEYDPCTEEGTPCQNEGTCLFDNKTCQPYCECKNGTVGHYCEGHDPCSTLPCHNGATCTPINATDFNCTCPHCYHGEFCDADTCADEGMSCGFHGKCNMTGTCARIGCDCDFGWTGQFCTNESTTLPPSTSLATTTTPSTTITTPSPSTTKATSTMPRTSTASNPCLSNNCQNGATCLPVGSPYTCLCAPPYTGQYCTSVMCLPPTTQILDAINGTWRTFSTTRFPLQISGLDCLWRIRAPPGQTVEILVQNVTLVGNHNGTFEVLDPTANNTSLYRTHGTNDTAVDVHSSQNLVAIYFDTREGSSGNFFLQYKSEPANPCAAYSCGANGTCVANGFTPECKCAPCTTGPHCTITETNPCTAFGSVCGNFGTCIFDPATCSNPRCNCTAGHSGPFCSSFREYKLYDTPNTDE